MFYIQAIWHPLKHQYLPLKFWFESKWHKMSKWAYSNFNELDFQQKGWMKPVNGMECRWAQQTKAASIEILAVGLCKGGRKPIILQPYSIKGGMFQTCIDFRYDVKGFVEDLPQLPEARIFHVCTSVPATGVTFILINPTQERMIKMLLSDPSPIIGLPMSLTH